MNESNKSKTEELPIPVSLEIEAEVFGRTDVGLVREHNEDNFLVADLTAGNRSIRPEVRKHRIGSKGSVFAVCDGMGGAAAGEVASQIAVDTIYDMMQKGDAADSDDNLAQKIEKAVCEAGRRILTAARLNRSQRGMGTTVTVAALIGPRLLIGQVGDSRAYILRGAQLVQVTKDQSLVQQLIDAKQMTEEEARTFDKNNIILQALGTAEEVHVDITSVILKKNDRLVMCSDGLSGIVNNDAIRNALLENEDPIETCKTLTDLACKGGGHDNITVIVARFTGNALDDPPENQASDPELVYSKFTFNRSSEITARKMRPDRPVDKRTGDIETTQPIEAIFQPSRQSSTSKNSSEYDKRSPSMTFLYAAAVLAALAVAVAFFASRRNVDSLPNDTQDIASVPPPPQPSIPSVITTNEVKETVSDSSTSASEVNDTEANSSIAAVEPPSMQEEKAVEDDSPNEIKMPEKKQSRSNRNNDKNKSNDDNPNKETDKPKLVDTSNEDESQQTGNGSDSPTGLKIENTTEKSDSSTKSESELNNKVENGSPASVPSKSGKIEANPFN